jgi:hypothetical protein
MIKTNILVKLSLTGLLIFGSCGKDKNKTPQDNPSNPNKPIDPTQPPIEPNKPIDPETVVTGTQCGQPDGFIGISTKEELQSIGSNLQTLQGNYFLCNDIDLKGMNFEPIGETYKPFLGQFDGNHKKILNLTIKSNEFSDSGIALFGSLGSKFSKVRNVHLENVDISSNSNPMASLVGSNYGTIENCSATGNISSDFSNENHYLQYFGGLVIRNYGYILKSYTNIELVIQKSDKTTIYIGGLVAMNWSIIKFCYATGNIKMLGGIGSLLGGLIGSNNNFVENSYATGMIHMNGIEQTSSQNPNNVGGLVGFTTSGYVINSYYPKGRPTGSVSSSSNTGTAIDITQQQSLLSGFSASDWKHTAGQWPLLAWQ